ncbi:unnamed protein product [Victoria cruziana]
MEVEPQVCARGVEEEEEETEVEEAAALIRKHKNKYGTVNGERNDVVPVFQPEIEKDEGGEDLGKPMVYFDAEERDKSSDITLGAFTPLDGHETDRTTVEEIVESLQITDLVKEGSGRTEVDLDAVLREQNTHDLYCPNCNSCITRRVILRKRKRTVTVHPGDAKREKVDLSSALNDNHDEQSADAEPEVFGCLQCLSIFIRTATGYELLSKMLQGRDGDKITSKDLHLQKENTISSNEDNVPADNKSTNCLAFLLEWGKGEAKVNDPEKNVATIDTQVPLDCTKQNEENENMAPDESGMLPVQQSRQIFVSESKVETVSDEDVPKGDMRHENQQKIPVLEKLYPVHLQHPQRIDVTSNRIVGPADSGRISENYGEDLKNIVPSIGSQAPADQHEDHKKIILLDEPEMLSAQHSHQILVAAEKHENVSDSHGPEVGTRHEDQNGVMVPENSELVNLQHPQQVDVASDRNVGSADSCSISENDGTDITNYPARKSSGADGIAAAETPDREFEGVSDSGKALQDKSATTSSKTYIIVPEKKDGILISSATKALPVIPGEKVSIVPIISHETRVEISSQVGDGTETSIMSERTFVADGWDVLKAIVYGGLVESITTLGVTSSAAGGDASTSSIVALGLANLIGGLFVIAHNILELKSDAVRYTEAIGQPQNFWRNTIIVILSCVLFGLVAPITYGFSFRESDNKDYKLIAVAIASLFCILILALGKARVTDRSYVKRVVHYVALGVAVSGVSYVVGVYVKKLLDQLGWISGSQDVLYHPSLIKEATGISSQNWVS